MLRHPLEQAAATSIRHCCRTGGEDAHIGGATRSCLRRGRRRDGTEDLRAAGDGARPAFTIAANYTDTNVYFLGGGVVESTPAFRDWFMGKVREHTVLRDEQTRLASFAVVPDLDIAGARGAALAALTTLQGQSGDLVHR